MLALSCHFGSRLILQKATGGGMSLGVAAEQVPEGFPKELAFGVAIVWGFGLLCGLALGQAFHWCRSWTSRPTTSRPITSNWHRIAVRAPHFLRRRRLVALAFNNYKNAPIGRPSKPTSSTRRRTVTPAPKTRASILHEGPALGHGSD